MRTRWHFILSVAATCALAPAALAQSQPAEPLEEIPVVATDGPASEPQPPANATATTGASTDEPAAAPRPVIDDPNRSPAPVSAEDILSEFQRERPVAEPLLPKPQPSDTPKLPTQPGRSPGATSITDSGYDPSDGPRARLPDGFILVDRAGRLVREGEWWVVTFVSDNHPQTLGEPPMKLLPNRMLERMVRESQSSRRTVEFIVTGEVTDFMGENYLLLRKLMRKRDMGNLTR
jgi:hypothetical protein